MNPIILSVFFAIALFVGMVALEEAGRRLGARRLAAKPEGARARLGAVEGAVFGLLGLLVAFTFSGAATRFDARRQLIVDEANCIGTAYRRLDLLATEQQEPMRNLFREYLDAKLNAYRKLPDLDAAMGELKHSLQIQDRIWTNALAACRASPSTPPTMLLLPSLNQMIDISASRLAATRRHPPVTIYLMLGFLALAGAFLAGDGMAAAGRLSGAHGIGFAAIVALTAYVTLDLEYPRFGFIRLDPADQLLVEVRQSMN